MSVHLAQRVAAGDMSPEVCEWMREGFVRHFAGSDLEEALGLDRASRLRERNRALLEAARLLDTGGGPWELAGLLSEAIKRFECRVLPMLRRELCICSAPIDRMLWDAYSTGQRIPRTQRKLYDLLR